MAWTDKPTDAQLNAFWNLTMGTLSTPEAKDAMAWLEKNANRRQVSDELGRIRDLYIDHNLTREECFNGDVWKEYFNAEKRIEELTK